MNMGMNSKKQKEKILKEEYGIECFSRQNVVHNQDLIKYG